MTSTYERPEDPEDVPTCQNKVSRSRFTKVKALQTDRETDATERITTKNY